MEGSCATALGSWNSSIWLPRYCSIIKSKIPQIEAVIKLLPPGLIGLCRNPAICCLNKNAATLTNGAIGASESCSRKDAFEDSTFPLLQRLLMNNVRNHRSRQILVLVSCSPLNGTPITCLLRCSKTVYLKALLYIRHKNLARKLLNKQVFACLLGTPQMQGRRSTSSRKTTNSVKTATNSILTLCLATTDKQHSSLHFCLLEPLHPLLFSHNWILFQMSVRYFYSSSLLHGTTLFMYPQHFLTMQNLPLNNLILGTIQNGFNVKTILMTKGQCES